MDQPLGRGLFGSLKALVEREIRDLSRHNLTLRRSRYPWYRRLLARTIVNRSAVRFLALYSMALLVTLVAEWAMNSYFPSLLPGYEGEGPRGFLKDVGGYLITAQIGILAIVSVAVGVVTLLSDRNDGSSVNTDIRLYYVESFAYELAISGVALLVVLVLQLFWPLQHLLHAAGLGGHDYVFKLALAALHAVWFALNLFLFLQFIITTLRFVEPSTRERLRERYCANEVIPRDALKRLMRAMYVMTPQQMFGKEELSRGPNIAFGHEMGLGDAPTSEVVSAFSRPTELIDVRMRPLRWVLQRWQSRVRKQPPGRQRLWQPAWNAQLTISASFDEVYDGPTEWVSRRSDVPLTRLERWIIRRCFHFAEVEARERDLPTPENFLEQLIDKVSAQIDQAATTGFRSALTDTIQFHRFILAAQNTRDASGNAFNLAEVGDVFSRPDADWVAQYRRIFASAAEKIGTDTSFMNRMSNVAARLVPDDAPSFSSRVLQSLLTLGIYEVIALENWLTKRAVVSASASEAGASTSLSGSDKRAYEDTLVGFVSGWEALLQTLISALGLERRPSSDRSEKRWKGFAASFPVLQAHLHNAAYFFAASVWNDDPLGADRLRDMLLRWVQPFYGNLQSSHLFSAPLLFTPDLVNQNWSVVQAYVASHVRFPQEHIESGPVSGIVLWELHADVVCICGLVALYWYATKQQPSETAATAAKSTLNRELRPSDGSTLTQMEAKTTFRLLSDFAIRYALNPRFAEARYSSTLDGLVRHLTDLTSPRMVSGRVYGGFGINGVDTLRTVLLAAMAAHLPERGDDGFSEFIEEMKADPLFADDKTVRTFIWTIQQMAQHLDNVLDNDIYERAARAFNPDRDLSAVTVRLREIFTNVVASFEALRKERLRNAPLDEARMEAVRNHVTDAVLRHGPSIGCFVGYSIQRQPGEITPTETQFGVIDKGAFVNPPMSDLTFEELPPLFLEVGLDYLNNLIWHSLYHRPKRIVVEDVTHGTQSFWRHVITEASTVGSDPIVIVPFRRFGDAISAATIRVSNGELAGFEISHVANTPSGGGTGYVGTINGVDVYTARFMNAEALLCSRRLIRTIGYGVVHGDSDIFDFSFVDGEDLTKSQVRLKFAQTVQWSESEIVEFRITGLDGADE